MTFKKHLKNYIRGLVIVPLSIFVFSPFFVYAFVMYILLTLISPFSKRLSSLYYRYSLTLALSIDQLANASIHGNEDLTISGRLGYHIYILKTEAKILVFLCRILSLLFRQKKHCYDAIEYDRIKGTYDK